MNDYLRQAWIAIAAIAATTYVTRGLPFLLSRRWKTLDHLAPDRSRLTALGPALLAAMGAAMTFPALWSSFAAPDGLFWPSCTGLAMTLGTMRLTMNVGLAVVAGMAGYAVNLLLIG